MPAAATYYPSLLLDYLVYAVVLADAGGSPEAACAVAHFEACKPPRPPLARTCRDPWSGELSIVNGTCGGL